MSPLAARLFTLALAILMLASCAHTTTAVGVVDAWARPTAGSMPGAVYFNITNRGDRPDRLIGARSDCCATIEIHGSRVDGGRTSMTPMDGGISLDVGTTVELEPGGYHLMLFEPTEPLRVGRTFTVILELDHGGEIPIEVEVRH